MTASSCQHVYTLHVEHNTPFVPPWYNLRTICCSKSSSTSSKLKPSESKTSNTACRWCSQRMKHIMKHWNFTKIMQRHLQMTLEYALFKQLFHDIRLANAASNIYHPKMRPDGPLQKDHLPPPKDAIPHHTHNRCKSDVWIPCLACRELPCSGQHWKRQQKK